ncbi:MAG TPA: NAD(P)-dependent oxidoreductase [Chloroflexota bacterium]|jgi:nucleoside-diphosphate-sugar epimerase|nr:NAD(P)-dependent oxidoreductase [Chloroflexota bacterium]
MANVLITGGAGYVGAVVTGMFLAAGHTVTVLDSLVAGGQGLLAYAASQRFRFIRGDVRDPQAVGAALAGQDAVVHLAAVVGFGACNADPHRASSVNVDGTRVLLAARDPRQLLLYASTGSVYGAVPDGLCHEGIAPAPLSLYGRTKLQAEGMILETGNAIAFRFATAFGMSPHMRLDLLVNEFAYSARRRGFVIVYDKDARRTFIHVRDMARAFLFGLEHAPSMAGGVYNAGSERLNLTKAELAQLILARQPHFLCYGPIGRDEDRRDYAVSYAKLRALGFEVEVSIEAGIDELLRGVDLLP